MKTKNYVDRPWTQEEEEDFQRFCESIGQMPEDPEHAACMQDGEVDFLITTPGTIWSFPAPNVTGLLDCPAQRLREQLTPGVDVGRRDGHRIRRRRPDWLCGSDDRRRYGHLVGGVVYRNR